MDIVLLLQYMRCMISTKPFCIFSYNQHSSSDGLTLEVSLVARYISLAWDVLDTTRPPDVA